MVTVKVGPTAVPLFGDFNGNAYAIDAQTGALLWKGQHPDVENYYGSKHQKAKAAKQAASAAEANFKQLSATAESTAKAAAEAVKKTTKR